MKICTPGGELRKTERITDALSAVHIYVCAPVFCTRMATSHATRLIMRPEHATCPKTTRRSWSHNFHG